MSKHTKGPWEFCEDDCGDWRIYADGRAIMGDAQNYPWVPESDADWHLIAAAPDLLEALRGMIEMYVPFINSGDAGNWDPETEPEVIAARAAIAKATGEEK